MSYRRIKIHSPKLCEQERCNNVATSSIVLDHELQQGRTVRMRVCEKCAIALIAEDAELARKGGWHTDSTYRRRDYR